jgi:3',5'-cyclic AMP phosphodiesterase CpdA
VTRLAWGTDVHLNFVSQEQRDRFADTIAAGEPDAVALTGDIAEADSLEPILLRLADRLRVPVYFVLGNHDFYGSSIAAVRARAAALTRTSPYLRWMPVVGVRELGGWGVIGQDGWGDGRFGDPRGSRVVLNDWFHIEDLRCATQPELLQKLAALGDESAAQLAPMLDEALSQFAKVLVLTHVPPFREAAWHEGKLSDDQWVPWFACRAVGEVLREKLAARPDRKALVLCGHTHGAGTVDVLPNLRVETGGAKYGSPTVRFVKLS